MTSAALFAVVASFAARIAIVSSSNEAAGRATLRYADRDGERMAAVLSELGSLAPADVWRLPHATAPTLREALDRAEARAASEPGSTIIFYFSGHADGEGLLLGDDRFGYRELRERLARSHAQVRVAVLDACNSGSATKPKGGHQGTGPVFTPVDPLRVDGAAILAASGAEELAQESSDVEGSYFTHHLISGLRGAGDRDGNGVVTLGEAYAYVYARTVAATVPSLWGPQHPSYDYRLSGTGDLALTTLERSRQGLTFPAAADGSYTVFDADHDVVAERRASRVAAGPLPGDVPSRWPPVWRRGQPGHRLGRHDLTRRPEGREPGARAREGRSAHRAKRPVPGLRAGRTRPQLGGDQYGAGPHLSARQRVLVARVASRLRPDEPRRSRSRLSIAALHGGGLSAATGTRGRDRAAPGRGREPDPRDSISVERA
jgi:hypothetical protein